MKIKKSFTDSMAQISLGINGTLNNPAIMARMIPFGYTEEVMNIGKAKLDTTQAASLKHQREYGEQYTAFEEKNLLWSEAQTRYKTIITLSRIALKGKPGVLHSLRATGSRSRSLTGFIKDARFLYNNLLAQPECMEIIRKFGITAARLNAENHQINDLERAYENFFKEKGEAQDMTVKRDQLFDDLYNWYSDFRAVARLALNDSPQMLEELGIVVKR